MIIFMAPFILLLHILAGIYIKYLTHTFYRSPGSNTSKLHAQTISTMHLLKTRTKTKYSSVRKMVEVAPLSVIVGEWSLASTDCAKHLNGCAFCVLCASFIASLPASAQGPDSTALLAAAES